MRTILKWLGRLVGALIVLIIVVAAIVYVRSEQLVNETYHAPDVSITVPTDAASLERGHHMATVIADCTGCHGANFGGGIVIDDPALGRIVAPNLTSGKNGLGGTLSPAVIASVIRYGVKPDGHSVLLMPSDAYTHLTDADLGAVVAYVKSMPPVDSNLPGIGLGPLGRVLLVAGQLPIIMAINIDENAPHTPSITPAVNADYGKYLVSVVCQGCHGPGLSGGHVPGTPPSFANAANLTPSGEVGSWSEADFAKAIRTGVTPNGKQLDQFMPYKTFVNLTSDEVQALWAYVHSVPARPNWTR